MEALQQASLLCETCPEAAATEHALSHAEQLMAATIKKVRLTLKLAVTIKQQQRQEQQVQQAQLPWLGAAAGMALLPGAAAAAAAKVPPVAAAAAAAAAEYCDPSTADSACSGCADQLVLPQLRRLETQQGDVDMPLLHAQQQQQHQQYSQDAMHFAQQGAEVQEEVASSWE
jgi:hypothetical protein